MPLSNNKGDLAKVEYLSDLFIWDDDPIKRQGYEKFRIEYEKEHGPTDLTKRYTSQFPTEHQNWLVNNYAKRYWDGLPPFLQAYLRQGMDKAKESGKLDDAPPNLLRLYLNREMNVGGDGPEGHGR